MAAEVPSGLRLGVWQGTYQDTETSWLRWYIARADERAARLARRLRDLGYDPDQLP